MILILSLITISSALFNIIITVTVKRLRKNKLFYVILFMCLAGIGNEIFKTIGALGEKYLSSKSPICGVQGIM